MGTVVSIDVRLPAGPVTTAGPVGPASNQPKLTAAAVDAAIASAILALHRADDDFSTFRPASWVSRLRRGEIDVDDCPEHVREVHRLATTCRERTRGYFDPGWRADGTLDPTGLVKGWAADAASAALTAAGITTHCVNAAGDLRASGQAAPGRPWRVGIADPFDRGRFVAVLECTDLAVATSGVAEQGQHVVNPRTGAPASGLASVTVVGPDLTLADAYATAGLAAGLEAWDLLADLGQDGWEWLTVEAAGRLRCSPGLRQQLARHA
ncbi:FAD:protein FMN transferase [Frankia sp. AgB1.9]|nr:FAD:protein FMN transferase [Frankia sp. AgW1.1]MBL7549460.1 FAD:protein FMN transferase [Frankia sp. AgB1.9]MBL7619924.1 FAD:protein FMN transferase [Frankia sp. AgB1.8]